MQIALGLSIHTDSHTAGRLAAQRALVECPRPSVAMVHSTVGMDATAVCEGIRSVLGRTPVFGATTPCLATNNGSCTDGVLLLLLAADDLECHIQSTRVGDDLVATGRYLVSSYLLDHPRRESEPLFGMLFGPEQHLEGMRYLEGIREGAGCPVVLCGGGSMGKVTPDFSEIFTGWQYTGRMAVQDHLAGLFFRPGKTADFQTAYAFESSWSPVAPPVHCSETQHNKVFALDQIPVREFLLDHLGDAYRDFQGSLPVRISFIARIHGRGEDRCLIRSAFLETDTDGRDFLSFFPSENMQDVELQLVYLSRDEMLRGVRQTAEKARDRIAPLHPRAVIFYSCHSRKMLLHSRIDEEVDRVRRVFGADVPIFGMYAGGEYGPLQGTLAEASDPDNPLAGTAQFSTSISLMIIGSQEENPAGVSWPERLTAMIAEDRSACQCMGEDTAQLLHEAEDILQETENALKGFNARHLDLLDAFRRQNAELEKARQQNEELQAVIRRHTPHKVWKKAALTVQSGFRDIPEEEIFCTMMFMDIKGFTSFAEKNAPHTVIQEINKIFTPATEIIYRFGGDVDKYIGDCIFAIFDYPEDALEAAMIIQQELGGGTDSPFRLRAGIHSGRAVSGNVGGAARQDHTLIGDAVNLTQRLEAGCTPGCVLVSDEVWKQIPESFREKLQAVKRSITVKGKTDPIAVREISCG